MIRKYEANIQVLMSFQNLSKLKLSPKVGQSNKQMRSRWMNSSFLAGSPGFTEWLGIHTQMRTKQRHFPRVKSWNQFRRQKGKAFHPLSSVECDDLSSKVNLDGEISLWRYFFPLDYLQPFHVIFQNASSLWSKAVGYPSSYIIPSTQWQIQHALVVVQQCVSL